MILPEIAAEYGRSVRTIRSAWVTDPAWPEPAGKRGRWLEYDPDEVASAIRQIAGRPPLPEGPDDLMTVAQAAAYTGLKEATIRADLSKGRWPPPDDNAHGVNRWKRSTIADVIANRRAYRRGKAGSPEVKPPLPLQPPDDQGSGNSDRDEDS